jgi:hypothetical protein
MTSLNLSGMPGLKSDSDTSDSDDDVPNIPSYINQSRHPPPRNGAAATAPAAAARASSRPNVPPSNSRPQPAPVSQQRIPVETNNVFTTKSTAASVPPSSSQRPAVNAPPFRHGNCIRVTGLQQRADLNGCPGLVIGEMDSVSERWPVEVIKGPGREFVPFKLRASNMTPIGNLGALDPADSTTDPQNIVLKDSNKATSDVQVRSQMRAQPRAWHRAALHLIGHKFYCSVRPKIQDFVIGFDMRLEIQKALENNDACVQYGLPLIFEHFGEIAFGADDPQHLFTMYFRVLPEALRNLPWFSKCHKFSIDSAVSDFKSVPLSWDTFCSSMLIMKRSDPQSQTSPLQSAPLIFNKTGFQEASSSSLQISRAHHPSPEGIACLTSNIRREIQSKAPTMNHVGLLYRELFEQAFLSSACALEFAKLNVDSAFRTVHPRLNNVSDAQALFFFTKAISLRKLETGPHIPNQAELREFDHDVLAAASQAQVLLVAKGKKLGRDFIGLSQQQEVFDVAKDLTLHSGRVQQLCYAAAVFARWAFRLGHADAKGLLHEMHLRGGAVNCNASYFLARIAQKSEVFDKQWCERIYMTVQKSTCQSAQKAKQRLLLLKWPKPVAALRIYVWFLKKRRQQPAQIRAKSLRDLVALLCEAELKSPYTFCKSHNTAVFPVALKFAVSLLTSFLSVHWKSPTEILDESTFGVEALPCADGLMPDPDSDDSTRFDTAVSRIYV